MTARQILDQERVNVFATLFLLHTYQRHFNSDLWRRDEVEEWFLIWSVKKQRLLLPE